MGQSPTKQARMNRRYRRRRAIAQLIGAGILFLILFTAGSGYFIYVNQGIQNQNQAALSAQIRAQQESQEHLRLGFSLCPTGSTNSWCMNNPGSLGISILNNGGIPSTIVAVFASNSAGYQLFLSSGSPYLNVTLPLTLPVGGNTSSPTLLCGGQPCNLGIALAGLNPSQYAQASPVTVSILTSDGNMSRSDDIFALCCNNSIST
jgi:hypothetical protein